MLDIEVALLIFLTTYKTLGTDKLMKMLFMRKVMDPQKTYHYTGTFALNTFGDEYKNK